MNPKSTSETATGSGSCAPVSLLGARPITPDDIIKESDRSYDLGRKHGHGEKADLLDWAETLLCNSLPMSHCSQEEWDAIIKNWRDQKHGVTSAPNAIELSDGAKKKNL